MISHAKKSSVSGAAGCVAYLTETEYYLAAEGKDGGTVWWGGKAAKTLGLKSGMTIDETADAMRSLMNGYNPETGAALVQNAGEIARSTVKLGPDGKPLLKDNGMPVYSSEGARVMCHDFTYSPPKAFSLLFAMADEAEQKRLRSALAEANERGMDYLSEFAETRTGSASQGKLKSEHAEIVRSAHVHFASREQQPQIHVHNVWYNVARGEDGKFRTLETRGILAARKDADRLATAHLASLVQGMGYQVEAVDLLDRKGNASGATSWTLADMPKEMERAWSKRRVMIEEYMAAHPGETAQAACLATRKGKDEPPLATLAKMWREEIAAEAKTQGWKGTAAEYHRDDLSPRAIDWRTWNIGELVDAVHDQVKKSAVSLSAIEAAVAMKATALDIDTTRQIAQEIAAEHFVEIGARGDATAGFEKRQTLYASHRWLGMEREIIQMAHASKNDRHHAVPAAVIDEEIAAFQSVKGFAMADEQVSAILHAAQDSGAITVIEGLAGTGKTTSIVVAVNSWKRQGMDVIGVSTSENATQKLAEESGIEQAYNGAKLLDMIKRDQLTLNRNHVLILDEAGMMDTRQAHGIMTAARDAGAKIVMMGDRRQLQSVLGGSPLNAAISVLGSAKLEGVRRQSGEHLKITKLLYGMTADGGLRTDVEERSREEIAEQSTAVYTEMERQELVSIHAETAQAVRDIAGKYTVSAVPLDKRIVLAHTHADREKLNAAIRPILRTQGVIQGDDHAVAQPGGRVLPLAVGDRIMFEQNHGFQPERDGNGRRITGAERTWSAHDKEGKDLAQLKIVNGGGAAIEAVRDETIRVDGADVLTHRITAVLDNGTRLSWRVDTAPQIGHSYATTIHKSQGQTMDAVWHLANAAASNEAVLVGFTRIKTNEHGTYHLAGTADDIEALKGYAIGRLNTQRNALDLIEEAEQARGRGDDREQDIEQDIERDEDIERIRIEAERIAERGGDVPSEWRALLEAEGITVAEPDAFDMSWADEPIDAAHAHQPLGEKVDPSVAVMRAVAAADIAARTKSNKNKMSSLDAADLAGMEQLALAEQESASLAGAASPAVEQPAREVADKVSKVAEKSKNQSQDMGMEM
jgi:conjugative relaxase-like TrwC/TraI family protein